MFIKKLILKGYKRLFLNNIDELVYTPETNIQILLGSNGSGKSSVLDMLTPLPADLKKKFKEVGYKYIEIEHYGKLYTLSSGYYNKNKHSFEVDGEELNHGGTKKAQSSLVFEHFGITNHIHDIILGKNVLTTMSPAERKKWFIEISDIDYSYSIAIFNSVKKRHRDLVGGIKIIQDSIIKTKENILSQKELNRMQENIKKLSEFISYLTTLYDHKVAEGIDINIDECFNIITNITNELGRLHYNNNIQYNSKEIYEKEITKLESRRRQLVDMKELLQKKIDELEITEKDGDIDKLNNRVKELNIKLKQIEENNKLDLDLDNIGLIYDSFSNSYSDIVGTVSTLSEFQEYNSKKEDIYKLEEKIDKIQRIKNKFTYELDYNITRRKELKESKRKDNIVKCNECGNEWFHGYDEKLLKKLTDEADALSSKLSKIEVKEKEIVSNYNKMIEKRDIIKNLLNRVSQDSLLKDIWLHIFTKYKLTDSTSEEIIGYIDKIYSELKVISQYSNYKKELEHINKKLDRLKAIQQTKTDIKNKNKDEVELELSNIIKDIYTVDIGIDNLKKEYKTIVKIRESFTLLQDELRYVYDYKKTAVEKMRNKYIMELVSELKQDMIEMEQTVNNNKRFEERIKDENDDLTTLKEKEKALKMMVKSLSPSEGIIAKSINSFLNVFVQEMNHIINSVWSYDIELLPCTVSEGDDLDYKFPVKVDNNTDDLIDDVGQLSTSMQEIVNLAYKIVFMKYKELTYVPLVLDEFGSSMDPVHRINAYNAVDTILSSSFSQVFIVNHYESMYGRFTNADISILDSKNLDTNNIKEYNNILQIN